MATIERVVEVNVPITEVYEQWSRVSEFPQFMEGVDDVQRLDENHVRWRATVGGREKEWDVEIVENIPNRLIAWRSINGPQNAGIVSFEPLPDDRSLVTYQVDYQPEGLVENMSEWLGLTIRRIERDLEHFKDFVEDRFAYASAQDVIDSPRPAGMTGTPIPQPDEYDHVSAEHRPEVPPPPASVAQTAVGQPMTSPGQTASSSSQDSTSTSSSAAANDASDAKRSTAAPLQQRHEERRHGDRRRQQQQDATAEGQSMTVNRAVNAASGEWRKLADNVERLFTRFMQRPYVAGSQWQKTWPVARWIPAVEATEREGKLVIHADVPGIKLEDLRIEIDDDLLTLRGERHEEQQDVDTRSFRSERIYGRFTRTIRLPPYVDAKGAEAVLRDGVLQISLPTPNRPQGRRIEVRSEAAH